MTTKDTILTRILAESDALWLPNRSWSGSQAATVWQQRQLFSKGGVAWESAASSDAERKETQRALAALARDGLVEVRRPHRVKVRAVRLTDTGASLARQMVGMPGLLDAWVTARELARHSRRPAKLLTDVWINERALIGNVKPSDFGREAWLVESMALPALSRGYIEGNSDTAGRVSYRLTDGGWSWIEGAPPDDCDGEPDAEAAALYDEVFRGALDRLATATPNDPREIGQTPLPVASVGVRV